jgi:group II intron reverse transcriptase/maturase
MIDYYETKAHPITKKMVLDAYRKVRSNGEAAGVDGVHFDEYAKDIQRNLYRLWNRLTSGSYFPQLTREKTIPKKGGGVRSLGIATVEDRIAQQVVRVHLELKVEPTFHHNSFGYRPKRNAHQAIKAATTQCFKNSWVLDLDIRSYFDSIDHELLLKAIRKYTDEKWVLMYIERWLKAGTLKEDGSVQQRTEGSTQGSVVSPLLSNVFLHFVFDKWMEKNYPTAAFERYSDDIIVHCKTEKQAIFLKYQIAARFKACMLSLSDEKTRLVFCKNPNNKGFKGHTNQSFDFLGFTFKPRLCKTVNGMLLLSMPDISRKSEKSIANKIRSMQIDRKKMKITELAKFINQTTAGWINYYFGSSGRSRKVWWLLNKKILKWVIKNRTWGFKRALRWIKSVYSDQPRLFLHWGILKP